MKKYVLICTGGFLGAVLRYLIREVNIDVNSYFVKIPINTLLINITGSFVLALVLTAASKAGNFDEDIKSGIAAGFLGAFTTFSTMCREIVELIFHGYYYTGILYLMISVIMGIAAAYAGATAAGKLVIYLDKQNVKYNDGYNVSEAEIEAGAD